LVNLNTASREIIATTRKVIALQVGVSALIAAAFFMAKGAEEAYSAFYGGLISVVVAFLLGRGVVRAAEAARQDPKKSMLILYLGAVQRFILVLVLFGIGFKVLSLAFVPMIAGFAGAQLAYLSNRLRGTQA
jgi:ATP synthase protein I